jgi:gamma-glutamyl phosphate reductase
MALNARSASRHLQTLPTATREAILHRIADSLVANESRILEENAKDVAAAQGAISDTTMQRLVLKPNKIAQLAGKTLPS